jgi:cytochrome c peroxidase
VRTLQTAVRVMAACQLGLTVTDKQVNDIVSFLDSLTGKFPKETMPILPETPNTTIMMNVSRLQQDAVKSEKK